MVLSRKMDKKRDTGERGDRQENRWTDTRDEIEVTFTNDFKRGKITPVRKLMSDKPKRV